MIMKIDKSTDRYVPALIEFLALKGQGISHKTLALLFHFYFAFFQLKPALILKRHNPERQIFEFVPAPYGKKRREKQP